MRLGCGRVPVVLIQDPEAALRAPNVPQHDATVRPATRYRTTASSALTHVSQGKTNVIHTVLSIQNSLSHKARALCVCAFSTRIRNRSVFLDFTQNHLPAGCNEKLVFGGPGERKYSAAVPAQGVRRRPALQVNQFDGRTLRRGGDEAVPGGDRRHLVTVHHAAELVLVHCLGERERERERERDIVLSQTISWVSQV